MKQIYFDHAATTPTNPVVAAAMVDYMTQDFGNPSSPHSFGRKVRPVVRKARQQIASLIGAKTEEIFFTSGGSESDNWALKGIAFAQKEKGRHIITTAIEHHAVLHTCQWLERQGFEITYLPVDEEGMVRLKDVEAAIRPETILISVMFANNEVGTIEPIAQIGALAHEKNIYFHTDAVQAAGHVKIDVEAMHIDMLSLSGHKFYGPKGIGVLYIRHGVKIETMQQGGSQEKGMRAGTENTPAIVGIGLAAELAEKELTEQSMRLEKMRDDLIEGIEASIPGVRLNGSRTKRLPGNVHFSFSEVSGEALLMALDMKGAAVASGSACTSGSLDPSHVLLALGLDEEMAAGSIRISIGQSTMPDDIRYLLDILPGIIERIRNLK